jgi:hypothetical protein
MIPHYAPTLVRWALPLIVPGSMFDKISSSTYASFADHVTTLPIGERTLLVHAMEKPIAAPLYQLVLRRMLPSWSSAMKVPLTIMVPMVGYLALTRKFYRDAYITRGSPMHSDRAER